MTFEFTAPLWLWDATKASWYFVALPAEMSDEIEVATADVQGGFGSVKVRVTVEGLTWSTSLFPDRSRETYVLPIKKQVRQHAGVGEGDELTLTIEIVS